MISPPDSVLSIWFLFVKCNSYYPKSLDLLEEGKLGDPGEHKIKRRQLYREHRDLSSDEKVIFREESTSYSDRRWVVLQYQTLSLK